MKQEIAWTNNPGVDAAVDELMRQIHDRGPEVALVMFFAGINYDFEDLSRKIKDRFPGSEVVGCSTSGEISAHGFTKNSIVLTTMVCDRTKVRGVLVRGGAKYPMVEKDNILMAMRACGIYPGEESHKDSFAITFINGLCNAEECMLSLLYAIVQDNEFQVLGGSAGDNLQFNTTYSSLNGECVSDGGVIVFVKTSKKFTIQKENIFKPSGRKVVLTGVDTVNRKLLTIDGKPATTEYARAVGIPESRIDDASLMNPLGRMFGDNIFISSIAGVNSDRSFNMYCRVMPNTKVDIMELGDVKAIMKSTCDAIEKSIPRPGFVFFINCILRTLAFETNDHGHFLVNLYQNRFGKVVGFSSYGEQIGKVNSNQTLVVLAMEE